MSRTSQEQGPQEAPGHNVFYWGQRRSAFLDCSSLPATLSFQVCAACDLCELMLVDPRLLKLTCLLCVSLCLGGCIKIYCSFVFGVKVHYITYVYRTLKARKQAPHIHTQIYICIYIHIHHVHYKAYTCVYIYICCLCICAQTPLKYQDKQNVRAQSAQSVFFCRCSSETSHTRCASDC